MGTILTDTAATALWHDLVREAEQRGKAPLDSDMESYLVFVLMRHLRDAGLGGHVLALDYLSTLASQAGATRRDNLREVGDRCLLIAGLYPQQAERRMVGLNYFLDLGSQAYAELAEAARATLAELYRRMAATFGRLVRVLVEVRRLSNRADAIDALGRHALCMADPDAAWHEFPNGIVVRAGSRVM